MGHRVVSPHDSSRSDPSRDPYQSVVLVLFGAAVLGTIGAAGGGVILANRALLEVAVSLFLAAGVSLGVALAARARRSGLRPQTSDLEPSDVARGFPPSQRDGGPPKPSAEAGQPRDRGGPEGAALRVPEPEAGTARGTRFLAARARMRRLVDRVPPWFEGVPPHAIAGMGTAVVAATALVVIRTLTLTSYSAPAGSTLVIGAALCVIAAGLAATAVRYLAGIAPGELPEASGLCRGGRVLAWVLLAAAASIGFEWARLQGTLRTLDVLLLIVNALACYGLFASCWRTRRTAAPAFPVDFGVLTVLGSRVNILASTLDAAENQLGIDLRSTWALMVVRRLLEPLLVGLGIIGWLSTSLTVVGLDEQGLVERLGVAVPGPPLSPGLHLHWPWPIDQVFRFPVQRVQLLAVGRAGSDERGGPEDVLWARQHAENEYTLLLGNGRDLITVDAAVQYRIVDARAWHYHTEDARAALRAIAHRAVMKATIGRTLAEALSENLVTTTAHMREMVQQEADALALGVEIVGFTVGGMHPPTRVAAAYQGVVSAEVGKVTAVVNAQAYRNQIVPEAQSWALREENAARAEAAQAMAKAIGEAWSFLTLQAQYQAAPGEYFFRRRLETLEQGLGPRRHTVVDVRFLRDGGELWITR